MKTAGLILAFAALACGKQPPPPPADHVADLKAKVANLEQRLADVEARINPRILYGEQFYRAFGPKEKVSL